MVIEQQFYKGHGHRTAAEATCASVQDVFNRQLVKKLKVTDNQGVRMVETQRHDKYKLILAGIILLIS